MSFTLDAGKGSQVAPRRADTKAVQLGPDLLLISARVPGNPSNIEWLVGPRARFDPTDRLGLEAVINNAKGVVLKIDLDDVLDFVDVADSGIPRCSSDARAALGCEGFRVDGISTAGRE